ncbi:Beta-glucosidase 42 [Asimina triloba]
MLPLDLTVKRMSDAVVQQTGFGLSRKYFADYAEACFANFGDRVKHWITLNEPLQTSVNGYCTGVFAPGRKENSLVEPYLAAHYQLLAHAAAVAVYREKFKAVQGGEIGITVDCEWAEAFSDSVQDRDAALRRIDFQLGWYLDPIFFGDYPVSMRERLGDKLPKFSEEEKESLWHSTDFVGLNHYTARLIAHASKKEEENGFYQVQELARIVEFPGGEVIGEKAASEWLYIVPWGIRKVLNHIAERYGNPPIYVTENGMDEEDSETPPLPEALDDKKRVDYFRGYLAAVAQSIRDGTDIRGYFAWSFMDNFEWAQGYTKRFGIVYVDYKNGLLRHPKSSAIWFSRFLKGNERKNGKED